LNAYVQARGIFYVFGVLLGKEASVHNSGYHQVIVATTSEGAERMGAVPPSKQRNRISRTTPSVAVAFKAACQSWLLPGTRFCLPHHCPGFLMSRISESTRADLFSGRALRPLRGGTVASCTIDPSRVFTASATHTLVLFACVMAGPQFLCSLCALLIRLNMQKRPCSTLNASNKVFFLPVQSFS